MDETLLERAETADRIRVDTPLPALPTDAEGLSVKVGKGWTATNYPTRPRYATVWTEHWL